MSESARAKDQRIRILTARVRRQEQLVKEQKVTAWACVAFLALFTLFEVLAF